MRKLLVLAAIPLAATLGGGVAVAATTGGHSHVRHDISGGTYLVASGKIPAHGTKNVVVQCDDPNNEFVSGGGYSAPAGVTVLASRWGNDVDWVATFRNTTSKALTASVYVVCLS